MENRRINIVCNYASEYGGNFIPSLLNAASKLRQNGNYVIFSFPNETENRGWIKFIKDNGFDVFFYGKTFKKSIKLINKNNKINAIYSHFISGLKIKLLYPFNRRMKLFIHVHSDFTGNRKQKLSRRIKNRFEHIFLRKDAVYIYVSKALFMKNKFKNHFYIPNALCSSRIPCEHFDEGGFKKEYGIQNSDTLFLLFGWSPFVKGVDIAVRAFLKLDVSKQKNSKLIIVHGRGDGYSKCVDFLKSTLGNEDFLVNKNIIFTKPIQDIFALYKMSDVFISSSRSEGFSYSILESLYFNLNVILSNIEGSAWANKYPQCTNFDAEDYEKLANIMEKSIGFKKKSIINDYVASEYNIEVWSNDIAKIVGN